MAKVIIVYWIYQSSFKQVSVYLSKVYYYYSSYYFLATRISNDTARKSALINHNIYFVLFSRVDGFSLTDPCLKKTLEGLLQIRQTRLLSESTDSKMNKMFLTFNIHHGHLATKHSCTLLDCYKTKRINCCRNIGLLGLHAGIRKEHLWIYPAVLGAGIFAGSRNTWLLPNAVFL